MLCLQEWKFDDWRHNGYKMTEGKAPFLQFPAACTETWNIRAEQRWVNNALLHTTTDKYLAFVALCTWRNNFSYFSMFGDTNLLLWCFIKYIKLNYHTAFCTRLYHHALYRQITQNYLFWLQHLPPVSSSVISLVFCLYQPQKT